MMNDANNKSNKLEAVHHLTTRQLSFNSSEQLVWLNQMHNSRLYRATILLIFLSQLVFFDKTNREKINILPSVMGECLVGFCHLMSIFFLLVCCTC